MAKKRTKAAQDNAGLNVDGMGMLGGPEQGFAGHAPAPGAVDPRRTFSTRVTDRSSRRAKRAAVSPAEPPPMISRS